ncbi:MAG: GGDEF domain-containing protein [Lachnospiraceae bacterium]|jgi:diguanylate cyclase (GGDEF)-like protein|nr:GGDEF domain-containing protein [Lachnospiraceae bacterium]
MQIFMKGGEAVVGTERIAARIKLAAVACVVVHSFLMISFFSLGIHVMAIFNCFSVIVYLLMAIVIDAANLRTCTLIAYYEIMIHSTLALILLGWESGFALYIFAMIPMAFYVLRLTEEMTKERKAHIYMLSGLAILMLLFTRILHITEGETYYLLSPGASEMYYLFNASVCLMMLIFASLVFAHEKKINQEELADKEEKLSRLEAIDDLTGIMNRHSMIGYLRDTHKINTDNNTCYHIAIGDIDNFRLINDEFGHEGGDEVIRTVAAIINKHIKGNNQCARWGAEEFLLLLCHDERKDAIELLETVRKELEETDIICGEDSIRATITFGITCAHQNDELSKVFNEGNRNLHLGKGSGKNKVVG